MNSSYSPAPYAEKMTMKTTYFHAMVVVWIIIPIVSIWTKYPLATGSARPVTQLVRLRVSPIRRLEPSHSTTRVTGVLVRSGEELEGAIQSHQQVLAGLVSGNPYGTGSTSTSTSPMMKAPTLLEPTDRR